MKTLKISILSLLTLCLPMRQSLADDHNVSLEQARDVAAYAVAIEQGTTKYDASDARLVYQINNPVLGVPSAYFFNVGQNAFAIVAGHRASSPLIGFSVDDTLQVNNLPPAMKWWVESYSEMIVDAQLQDLQPADDVAELWQELEEHTLKASAGKATNWLIDDKWDQGDNDNPTYNLYCPVHFHKYCLTGCVATATAMIIHYYQYPTVGRGSKAFYPTYTVDGNNQIITSPTSVMINYGQTYYDYDHMPVSLSSQSDSAEIKAVAQLMFHVGVAVAAEYGLEGTSAHSENVPNAMRVNFKYNYSTQIYRQSYTDEKWLDTLRYSIDRKAPLYFSAGSSTGDGVHAGGHAFICHGYHPSQRHLFRISWGWSGMADGWFNMSNIHGLNPGQYDFSERQAVLMGMTPPDDSNRYLGIREVHPVVLHAAYPNPATYQVVIPYTLNQNANAVMQIFDMAGRQVEQRVLVPGSGEVRVNVSAYPKGVYLYRVQGGDMRKFVVQ